MGCDRMRESVRRLCSPFTASKPSPMAINGTRNDSNATSGRGPPRVNSRRNRNGSSAVISLIWSTAPRTTATAVATTRTTSTTTRMLVKWSATSFRVTTPKPCKAEPSRRMTLSCVGLEVARIDRFEARFLDRKAQEAPAGRYNRSRCFRPHVAVGKKQETLCSRRFDPLHARNSGDAFGEPLPLGFHLHAETAAEHLTAEVRHAADEGNVALIEQGDAIANALRQLEQV